MSSLMTMECTAVRELLGDETMAPQRCWVVAAAPSGEVCLERCEHHQWQRRASWCLRVLMQLNEGLKSEISAILGVEDPSSWLKRW